MYTQFWKGPLITKPVFQYLYFMEESFHLRFNIMHARLQYVCMVVGILQTSYYWCIGQSEFIVWWFNSIQGYYVQEIREIFTQRACQEQAVGNCSVRFEVVKFCFSYLRYKIEIVLRHEQCSCCNETVNIYNHGILHN